MEVVILMIGGINMDKIEMIKRLHGLIGRIDRLKNFDLESFYYNFNRLVYMLERYHNSIGKNAKTVKELSAIQIDIPKSNMPKEGQVAYFYIETSYPKEIYNSHWCFVLKDLGSLLEKPLGKSGVNHRLKKIIEIADEAKKENA